MCSDARRYLRDTSKKIERLVDFFDILYLWKFFEKYDFYQKSLKLYYLIDHLNFFAKLWWTTSLLYWLSIVALMSNLSSLMKHSNSPIMKFRECTRIPHDPPLVPLPTKASGLYLMLKNSEIPLLITCTILSNLVSFLDSI